MWKMHTIISVPAGTVMSCIFTSSPTFLPMNGTLVHDDQKVLQDSEVEGRGQQLSAPVPLAAPAGQQAGSQPRVEEVVVGAFCDVLAATQYPFSCFCLGNHNIWL